MTVKKKSTHCSPRRRTQRKRKQASEPLTALHFLLLAVNEMRSFLRRHKLIVSFACGFLCIMGFVLHKQGAELFRFVGEVTILPVMDAILTHGE